MTVEIYTSGFCGYCVRAKSLLEQKGIAYREIRVDQSPEKRIEMLERAQRRTVPQIFVAGVAIGGFDELYSLERSGKLNELLQEAS